VGALVLARGELWGGEAPDESGRSFLVASRDAANEVCSAALFAPVIFPEHLRRCESFA
jgi:hypothetical protein